MDLDEGTALFDAPAAVELIDTPKTWVSWGADDAAVIAILRVE